MKTFETDQETRLILAEVSALLGIKAEVVKEVWEFTILSLLLKVADKPDNNSYSVSIPYIGRILLRKSIARADDGSKKLDVDPFISLSDKFKKLFYKVINGKYAELSEFVENAYLKKTILEI